MWHLGSWHQLGGFILNMKMPFLLYFFLKHWKLPKMETLFKTYKEMISYNLTLDICSMVSIQECSLFVRITYYNNEKKYMIRCVESITQWGHLDFYSPNCHLILFSSSSFCIPRRPVCTVWRSESWVRHVKSSLSAQY